jgi:hypothetical protein
MEHASLFLFALQTIVDALHAYQMFAPYVMPQVDSIQAVHIVYAWLGYIMME